MQLMIKSFSLSVNGYCRDSSEERSHSRTPIPNHSVSSGLDSSPSPERKKHSHKRGHRHPSEGHKGKEDRKRKEVGLYSVCQY